MTEHIREAIRYCEEQRDQALAAVTNIERDGWRHFLGQGEQEPVEITKDFAARERRTVERMNQLIAAYEAYLA